MAAVATMNVGFTYQQILSLAMQLQDAEKITLCNALQPLSRMASLEAIRRKNIGKCALSEDDIVAECKAVRQEMYAFNRTY